MDAGYLYSSQRLADILHPYVLVWSELLKEAEEFAVGVGRHIGDLDAFSFCCEGVAEGEVEALEFLIIAVRDVLSVLPPVSALRPDVGPHAFAVEQAALGKLVDPEEDPHGPVASDLEVEPLPQAVGVGVLPHEGVILVLGRPHHRRQVAALELRVELHLVLGVVFGLPGLRGELCVGEGVHCMLLNR